MNLMEKEILPNGVEQITIGGFDDFQRIFLTQNDSNQVFHNVSDFIFRGQSNAEWRLETTLQRLIDRARNNDAKDGSVNAFVNQHLNQFRLHIRGRRGENPNELGENDLWALGQHYGLATPLLDWSFSPYIALFFAFSSVQKIEPSHRSVWCLNKREIELQLTADGPWTEAFPSLDKGGLNFIMPHLSENKRLLVQSALFTKIGIDSNVEDWVVENRKENVVKNLIKKIRIKTEPHSHSRRDVLKQLDMMNINHGSLFPDLEGACQRVNILAEDFYA